MGSFQGAVTVRAAVYQLTRAYHKKCISASVSMAVESGPEGPSTVSFANGRVDGETPINIVDDLSIYTIYMYIYVYVHMYSYIKCVSIAIARGPIK